MGSIAASSSAARSRSFLNAKRNRSITTKPEGECQTIAPAVRSASDLLPPARSTVRPLHVWTSSASKTVTSSFSPSRRRLRTSWAWARRRRTHSFAGSGTAALLLAGSEVFEQQMVHAQFFDVFYRLCLQESYSYSEQARIAEVIVQPQRERPGRPGEERHAQFHSRQESRRARFRPIPDTFNSSTGSRYTRFKSSFIVCRTSRYDETTADSVQRVAERVDDSSPVDLRTLVHTVDDDDQARTVGATTVAPTGQLPAANPIRLRRSRGRRPVRGVRKRAGFRSRRARRLPGSPWDAGRPSTAVGRRETSNVRPTRTFPLPLHQARTGFVPAASPVMKRLDPRQPDPLAGVRCHVPHRAATMARRRRVSPALGWRKPLVSQAAFARRATSPFQPAVPGGLRRSSSAHASKSLVFPHRLGARAFSAETGRRQWRKKCRGVVGVDIASCDSQPVEERLPNPGRIVRDPELPTDVFCTSRAI